MRRAVQITVGWLMIPLGIGLGILHTAPAAGTPAVQPPEAARPGAAARMPGAGASPAAGQGEGGRPEAGQRPIDQVVIPRDVLDRLPELAALQQKLMQVDGVLMVGTDHRKGKVLVGVRSLEAKARVEAVIAREGVAPEWVEIFGGAGLLSEERPLEGCKLADPPRPDPGEQRLEIDPPVAAPGEEFTLRVRGVPEAEITRGVVAYLECWDGETWSPRFYLFTAYGGGRPHSVLYGGPVGVVALGLAGPGPEPHVVPEQLEPGWYRIRKPLVRTPKVPGEVFGYIQVR